MKSYEAVSHPVVPTIILCDGLIEKALARIFEFVVVWVWNAFAKFFNPTVMLRSLISIVVLSGTWWPESAKRLVCKERTSGKENTPHLHDPSIGQRLA